MDVLVRRRKARDEQGLLLRVLADPARAVTRAHARVLPAAHGQLEGDVVELGIVDADDSGLEPAGDLLAAIGVLRPDRGLQAVRRVVGELDRLIDALHLHHREGRTEGFLGHALHRVVDVEQ